jgi:hypothetical protein
MTRQTFRDLLNRRPFERFSLVMSNRATNDVRHSVTAVPTRSHPIVRTHSSKDGAPAQFK